MVNLIYIVLGTLAAGVGSVLVAALCARALLSAYTQHLQEKLAKIGLFVRLKRLKAHKHTVYKSSILKKKLKKVI